jgi:hypothetical protein
MSEIDVAAAEASSGLEEKRVGTNRKGSSGGTVGEAKGLL